MAVFLLFSEKHAPPAKAIRNEGQRQLPARFEGEPTYKGEKAKMYILTHTLIIQNDCIGSDWIGINVTLSS